VSIGHPARKGSAFQPFLPSSFPASKLSSRIDFLQIAGVVSRDE
jgi:hypothetical protein